MEGVLFYVTMLINKKSKKIFTLVKKSSILMRIRSNFINKVTLNIVKKRGKNEKYIIKYRNCISCRVINV